MAQIRKRYGRQFKVSAAKAVLSGEMTVKDLSEELGIKDSTLRRWACEYEETGDDALPETALRRSTRTTRSRSSRRRSRGLSARTRC